MRQPETGQFNLRPFSLRRKSIQINLAMLALLVVAVLIPVYGHHSIDRIREALPNEAVEPGLPGAPSAIVAEPPAAVMQAIEDARTRWIVPGIAAAALAVFIAFRLLSVGVRSVALEIWIRRMGAGDLDYRVEMKGRDEITQLAVALEELRQRSIKAMQLDLVKELSEGLKEKNAELERVLEELRRSQEQIVARQKLVELGELTAGVAHEIRNPLNFMKNFAAASDDLLEELTQTLDQLKSRLEPGQHRLLAEISHHLNDNMGRIQSNGGRLDRIVDDMIKIGRGGGRRRHVDINALLAKQTQLAYRSARAHDRRLHLDITTAFDPEVGSVPIVAEDMARVFANIVGNSCHATADKLRQREEAGDDSYVPALHLATRRKNDAIEIRIRDNGTGIPTDVMERIFNPFFTTKETDRGTGLGLSISHDIIRQHGGSITPASRAGSYTEMVIAIPAAGGKPAAGAWEHSAAEVRPARPAVRSEPHRVPPV